MPQHVGKVKEISRIKLNALEPSLNLSPVDSQSFLSQRGSPLTHFVTYAWAAYKDINPGPGNGSNRIICRNKHVDNLVKTSVSSILYIRSRNSHTLHLRVYLSQSSEGCTL